MSTITVRTAQPDLRLRKGKSMIQLENIEKVYRTDRIETVALTNVNLDVKEGEFISIMGPSGSGKSTLLNVIGLLDVPTGGRVNLNGNEITSYTDRSLARRETSNWGSYFKSSISSAT